MRFFVKGSAVSSPQSVQDASLRMQRSKKTVRVGVLGASGYTGSEVLYSICFFCAYC